MKTAGFSAFFFLNKFPNYTVHYQKKFPPLKIGIEHIGEM